jgi:hypothetical protein
MKSANFEDEIYCDLKATYLITSSWGLPFDLKMAHDWYIEWDTLYVKHHLDDLAYVEYDPDYSAYDEPQLKRPNWLLLNGEDPDDIEV